MSSKASYLSDPRCQCDFVVATTQASINSGLLEYLDEETQPIQYLCFLVDGSGYPTKQISLDDLKVKSKGIDPFYIPKGTPPGDSKVQALSDADFGVGVMMQMGMPAGYTPQSLPPIVTLNTASNVTFNLFCKQVKVVSIKWGRKGAIWNVFEQPEGPSGKPWSMKMSVDLTIAGLDEKLNTNYFNNHPKVRDQLRKALDNLSGTAFSLQQLLFDLDNAVLETVPDFSSVDDEDARGILEHFFRDMYVKTAKEHGLPLVAVTAVGQPKDESTLSMTGFERIVNPLKDGSGNPISNPNESQQAVATLDYLCAVNNNPVPRISSLDWNWVQSQDVNDSSGTISINRNVLSKYIASNLEKLASSACYVATIYPQNLVFSGNGTPVVTFPSDGSNVVHMDYQQSVQDTQSYRFVNVNIEYTCQVDTTYTLDLAFQGNTIEVVQHSQIHLTTSDDVLKLNIKVMDKTLTDTYGISVNQTGGLQLIKTDEQLIDQSDPIPTSQDGDGEGNVPDSLAELLQNIGSQALQNVKDDFNQSSGDKLHELQISQLQNFVFPGCRVFTYKDPFFSDHQDLVCKVTYLDPSEVSPDKTLQGQELGEASDKSNVGQDPTDSESGCASVSDNPAFPARTDTSTGGRLTASTELMQNYVQGQIISPANKFEALQTGDGHTLLFSCDTAGVFHVIEEQSGTSHTGWQVHDLSTTAIQTRFQSQASSAKVHTFDVGQSGVDGTIGMMMAVSIDGNDHLFASLGNSSDDISWIVAPTWTMVPFDPVNEQRQNITITGALFAETEDGTQYLVIDIDRPDGNMADPHIARYHIDPAPSDGHHWIKHDITVDISAGLYQSVVGRVSGKHVDGIYTAGHTGGEAQLVYEPVINWYGQGPPTPITLQLPGGTIPSAIATARNDDGSSDLYFIEGSSLYRFASDEQEGDDINPALLITSDLLVGTDTLRAMTHDGIITLWGRSRGDEVYYLSCETSQLYDSDAWKPPFPILPGVERMSTYLNRVDGGNTIFTAGNGRFQKITQGPAATGGIWRSQDITVAAPSEQKCTSFKSYTTTMHVTQKDQNLPARSTMVKLSSHSRAPVYINGLYYVLSSTPIQVATDTTGSLTIIDTTDSLHAAILTASLDSTTTITINPMDKAIAKLTALDSSSKLRGAQFPSKTVAGGVVGSPELTPLVDPSVNDNDVAAGAQLMGILKDSYTTSQKPANKTSTASASVHSTMLRTRIPHTTRLFTWGGFFGGIVHGIEHVVDDIGDTIKSLAGDVLQWAKKAAEAVGQIFKDAITGALHFFAKIGDKIYHAVLDTIHAVVGAVEWVYSKVKAGIKELIAFIEMLFEWDDIRRTKDVMHNAIKLWVQHQVDYIPKAKGDLDDNIDEFKERMKEWTGSTDLSSLGSLCQNPAGHDASNPNKDQTSGSKFLATHYQNHAHQVQILGDSPTMSSVEQLVNDLLAAISQEGTVLEASFNQLTKLANDFARLSVEEVLKRVAGILTEAALSSVQVVADTLLTVLHDLAQSAITILDTKIHIPIISDILKDIVSELSFLDLICWIAAMGFTVVYKLIEQTPPFPKDNEYVQAIISAGTWEDLEKAFGQSDLSLTPELPLSVRKPFFKACHGIAAFLGMIGNPLSSAEAASEASIGMLSKGATVITLVMTGAQVIGDELVPRYPVKNSAVKIVSDVASVLGIMSSIAFSSVGQSGFKAVGFSSLSVANPRGVGAVAGAILVLPRLVVTGWHFYELTKDDAGDILTAAILGEVSNLSSYASKVSYAVAVNDEEPDTRLIAVTVKAACDDIFSGLQAAESITGYS